MKRLVILLVTFTGFWFALPAHAEFVVIVSKHSATNKILPEQVAQIFLGKTTQMVPVDQAKDSVIRNEFYQKIANKSPAQIDAIWAKNVFTGKGLLPKEVHSDAEVKKAVVADSNAIGYIEKSALDDSVKVLLLVP